MTESQFLRDLLELIALDDVAYLIFAEVAELDAAFQTGTHLFHVVLESAQRRNSAVVNRLAFPQYASAGDAGDATIGYETTGDNASAQLENLFHFGVTDDGFSMFGIEQAGHRFFELVDQFINDAVKFDLHAFAFRGGHRNIFDLHVEADYDRVRRARQQNVRLEIGPTAE